MTSLPHLLRARLAKESNSELYALAMRRWPECQHPAVDYFTRGVVHESERLQPLFEQLIACVEAGERLLERIDRNGGIGEYNGGPAFVVEPLRSALAVLSALVEE